MEVQLGRRPVFLLRLARIWMMAAMTTLLFGFLAAYSMYSTFPKETYAPYPVQGPGSENIAAPRLSFSDAWYDKCILVERDPYDEEIMNYVDFDFNPKSSCNKSFEPLTNLDSGRMYIRKSVAGMKCEARCQHRYSDRQNDPDKWTDFSSEFKCDIVESRCLVNGQEIYRNLHSQIFEVAQKELEEPTAEYCGDVTNADRYNIHILLLDATSHDQAIRNLPISLEFLKSSFGAAVFPFNTRVGVNSKPNAFALLYGKQMEPIDRTLFGLPSIEPDLLEKESCDDFLDNMNLTLILTQFRNCGYKTMMTEDWATGVFNFAFCKGFNKQPTDHYMRPFQLVWSDYGNPLRKLKEENSCREPHHDAFEYMTHFFNSYEDTPKISFTWLSYISHDDQTGTVRLDKELRNLLLKNKKHLDNSFFILLGDHGPRHAGGSGTATGQYETNNPMLVTSIPRALRKSNAFKQLRANTRSLQTHYDLRAMLLDILQFQPKEAFESTASRPLAGEHGSSLLRAQSEPRTCPFLPIPPEYCLCQNPTISINPTSLDATEMGSAFVAHLNELLVQNNLTSSCETIYFEKVLELNGLPKTKHGRAYFLRIETKTPMKGDFKSAVFVSSEGMKFGTVDRLDTYARRGDCVEHHRMLCECRMNQRR